MRKKIATMMIAVLLLVAISAAASATLYYVTGNSVRVRSGPGTDYDVLAHLSRGAKIDVLSTRNGWARMTLWSGSDEGWISTRYISRHKPSSEVKPAQPSAPAGYNGFVAANYNVIVNPVNNYVNMRWEASKSSPVKRVYYYGAPLRAIAENGTWCQVMDETTNDVGFILKSLLLRTN